MRLRAVVGTVDGQSFSMLAFSLSACVAFLGVSIRLVNIVLVGFRMGVSFGSCVGIWAFSGISAIVLVYFGFILEPSFVLALEFMHSQCLESGQSLCWAFS